MQSTVISSLQLYRYDPEEEVSWDAYILGRTHPDQPRSGVLVEVVYYTMDFLNRNFEAVLQDYNPDLLKQNLIAGVVDSVPLHNDELIRQWQARAASHMGYSEQAMLKPPNLLQQN